MHGCAVFCFWLHLRVTAYLPKKSPVPLAADVDVPTVLRKQGLQVFQACPVMPIVMGMYSKGWGVLGGPP